MRLSDFDFDLPAELIAQHPAAQRTQSRLLQVAADGLHDLRFADLPSLLAPGDLLVFNDTRVLRARLFGSKATGGRFEALIERVLGEHEALAQLRVSKPPRPGTRLLWQHGGAQVIERAGEFWRLRFDEPVLQVLEREGRLPLPPYIEHTPDADDEQRYQTVYARAPGSVAAPTAGLHFDEALLERLRAHGVNTAFVTLHVGAGTFQPVRVEDLSQHRMHAERYSIPPETANAIAQARNTGARVIAVGTTSLRTLESAASDAPAQPPAADACAACATAVAAPSPAADGRPRGLVAAGSGETQLFITPGYRFRVVDRLITNFHLPKSTLLMLVSAFAGVERIRAAYRHAVDQRYRFFSYGDAMILDRAPANGDAPRDGR